MAILMSASADLKIGRANHHREQLLADLRAFRDRVNAAGKIGYKLSASGSVVDVRKELGHPVGHPGRCALPTYKL